MKKTILSVLFFSVSALALPKGVWDEVKAPPAELQNLVTSKTLDLQKAGRAWIAGAMREDYSSWGESAQKSVMVAYGIFNLGNHSYCEWSYWADGDAYNHVQCHEDYKVLKQLIHKVYASGILRQASYNWLKPVWVKAISEMDGTRQDTIAEAIDIGLNYATKLRDDPAFLKCETKYFNEQTAQNQRNHFSVYNPDSTCAAGNKEFYNPYRKMEAWVYRRMHSKEMTADKMIDWFSKVKKELF